jgi:hypothetical protein
MKKQSISKMLQNLHTTGTATPDALEKVRRTARGRGSKVKGASYERRIKDILQKAWGVSLSRTPLSGGFMKHLESSRFKGDLNTTDDNKELNLHLELKDQKTWSIHTWWKQTTSDCPNSKIPALIMHQGQQNEDGKRVREAEDFILLKLTDFLELVEANKIVKEVQNGNN